MDAFLENKEVQKSYGTNHVSISEIVGLLICVFEKRFGQFHPGKNDFENWNLENFDMRYRKKLGLIFN